MPGEDAIRSATAEAQAAMDKSLRSLRIELQKVRTGRANPALLDGVQVDYHGAQVPLSQLANLGAPDARLIVVAPYDRGALAEIERAIQQADLGLTPSSDGKVLRIPIPPLTEARRRELVKQVRKVSEDHKIGVRDARRHAVARLKELEGQGELPADDRRRAEKEIQQLTDGFIAKIAEMISAKEEEILEV